ncbi:hypothetical protein GDO86_009040 [Hymenochirus boettgeri]|uniref:GLTSCR protein conserved domain-containing protein n=1 Tax=Hymenochirus boettgeri TaxID=247094 RepID=A0A8T2JEG9_9PIPI|nr:hypothetical protein GDO86_009040 [Hymenochirus boettgeri]
MDDDDSGLLDLIGDQALSFFLRGSVNKCHADPKSSIKAVHDQTGEGCSDGLQISNSLQFLDDELDSSSIHDLGEDQPFDILQKSLQVANITEQTLAEEAYLDASVVSSQQFANISVHSHSSSSFVQAASVPSYSGETVHSVGETHVPVAQQQVGSSFASNTVGVQHGFVQNLANDPSQQISSNIHTSSGQIHLIGSMNNQHQGMAINHLDGSHIILKSGQQMSSNSSGGIMAHRQNGISMFGNTNLSPAGQPVAISCGTNHFQASLPVQNVIVHRGSVHNSNKMPITIQPKPLHVGQQMQYAANSLGMQQQHHVHQGVSYSSSNSPQNSTLSQQLPVSQQSFRKGVTQPTGSSIVINSQMGQSQGHPNQFLIPTGLSVNSCSVQQIQAINTQLVQTQPVHLGPHQVSTDHVMLGRSVAHMTKPSQSYSGQMLNSPATAVQLVPGQTFTGHGGQFILNHGTSHIVGGQMSATVLHLSPGQGNTAQSRVNFASLSPCSPNMPATNRFTVLTSDLQNMGPSFQTSSGEEHFTSDQQHNRAHSAMNEQSNAHPALFCSTSGQQSFTCGQAQKDVTNHLSPAPSINTQDTIRQHHLPRLTSGSKPSQHALSPIQLQENPGSTLQHTEVDGPVGGLKRPASRQLTKASLIHHQIHNDQERVLVPDKSQFVSMRDTIERLLPYHVFQGAHPTKEDIGKVDHEFESVSTHLLKKMQSMLNKYRSLLLEDAMRITPSAEAVMLDRMFNQEERAALTCEKRFAIVDPDGYLAEFCCSSKFAENLSSDVDLQTSKESSALHDKVQNDQLNVKKSSRRESDCNVPNKATSEVSSVSSVLQEDFHNDRQLKKNVYSPKMYPVNTCKQKILHSDTSTSCPSDPEVICRTSEETDSSTGPQIPMLNTEVTCRVNDKAPHQESGPSPEIEDSSKEFSKRPDPKSLMHSESLKEKPLEQCRSKKQEVDFEKNSATAPSRSSRDKTFPQSREGTAETDSILEAAVNSILEC